MEEQHDSEEGSNFNAPEDNAEEEEEAYESIECQEEKVQPISGSILLGSLRSTPMPSAQPSNVSRQINIADSPQQMSGSKNKRRSKNVVEGRMFKCQHCEKTYLSYPALYTHMKTKHAVPLEQASTINGRSRGRPKKVVRARITYIIETGCR